MLLLPLIMVKLKFLKKKIEVLENQLREFKKKDGIRKEFNEVLENSMEKKEKRIVTLEEKFKHFEKNLVK